MERVKQRVDLGPVFTSLSGCHLILLPDSPLFTIVEVTDAYLTSTYCKREEIIGQGVFQALTDNPRNPQATGVKNLSASLHTVLENKKEHRMAHQRYDVYNPATGQFEHRVWRPMNKPVLDDRGNVQYIIHTVEDVTETVLIQEESQRANEKLGESESLFRNMVEQAPVAILLSRGEDVVIESLNAPMLQHLNKTSFKEVLGKKMLEVLPELKDQPILQTVINVQKTGIPFRGDDIPVDLFVNGKLERHYFHFSITPIIESGEITGVLHVAVDVTQQVESLKKIDESRQELQLAIDIADLGTFRLDLHTNQATNSKKVDEWFGYEEQGYSREEGFNAIHPEDRDRVDQVILSSLQSEEVSRHDVIYRVVHPRTGVVRHLRSMGKALFDEKGKPYLIIGIIQDITQQIAYQKQLEESETHLQQKVLDRTLALEGLNQELRRSNQNLEEFAYAASHDMKEPIRKIHFFADRLKGRLEHKLEEEDRRYFDRLETGAKRMSTLIDDLLIYSHVNRSKGAFETVNLNQMLSFVLDDLELRIEEKGARVEIGPLPTIQGRPRQLQQLFENLIANALKYSKESISPVIKIDSHQIQGNDIGVHASAIEMDKEYHLIEIRDNGIGFEQSDAGRIFTVFTRLHGNAEYRGTGVGLSIVQKIVENHQGYVWAESQPGEGATFKVLLPVN